MVGLPTIFCLNKQAKDFHPSLAYHLYYRNSLYWQKLHQANPVCSDWFHEYGQRILQSLVLRLLTGAGFQTCDSALLNSIKRKTCYIVEFSNGGHRSGDLRQPEALLNSIKKKYFYIGGFSNGG